MLFFGVNRRKEELVDLMIFVNSMFGARLFSADDPKSAKFGFFEGVEAARDILD